MPGWQKETELRSAKSSANTISPFLFANTITNIEQSRVLRHTKLEQRNGLMEINLRIDSGSNESCGKTCIFKKFFGQWLIVAQYGYTSLIVTVAHMCHFEPHFGWSHKASPWLTLVKAQWGRKVPTRPPLKFLAEWHILYYSWSLLATVVLMINFFVAFLFPGSHSLQKMQYRTCNVKSARARKLLLVALGLHWVSHQDWWQGCSVSPGNDTSTLELQVQYVQLPKQCYIFWYFLNTKNTQLDVFLSILIGLAPRG